jgi:hypothetical protein
VVPNPFGNFGSVPDLFGSIRDFSLNFDKVAYSFRCFFLQLLAFSGAAQSALPAMP